MNPSPSVPGPDFIGRMVDKAFEWYNELEPRLPSLFEPPREIGAIVAVDGPAERPVARDLEAQDIEAEPSPYPSEAVRQTSAPSVAAAASHDAQADLAVKGPREDMQAATLRLDVPAPAECRPALIPARGSLVQTPTRSVATEPDREILSSPPSKTGSETHAEAIRDPQPENEAPLVRRMGTTTAKSILVASMFPAQEGPIDWVPSTQEVQDDITEPSSRSAKQEPVGASLVPASQRIVIEPPTAVHRRARAEPRIEAPELAPAPVAHVTIGRVEVRAMPAPPASLRHPAKAHGPRPMSLDDYLKQRGGGR
jgi:hypothetical protein